MNKLDSFLLDAYAELKHPKRYSDIQKTIASTIASLNIADDAQAQMDQRFKDEIIKNTTEGFPFTPEEMLEMVKTKRAKITSGGGRKLSENKLLVMLEAFLEIDRKAGTTTTAINHAYEKLNDYFEEGKNEVYTRKHIDKCLKKIQFLTNLKTSKSGRPTNNST